MQRERARAGRNRWGEEVQACCAGHVSDEMPLAQRALDGRTRLGDDVVRGRDEDDLGGRGDLIR